MLTIADMFMDNESLMDLKAIGYDGILYDILELKFFENSIKVICKPSSEDENPFERPESPLELRIQKHNLLESDCIVDNGDAQLIEKFLSNNTVTEH